MGAAEGDKERDIVRGRQGTVDRIDQFTKLYAKRTCKSSNNKNKDTKTTPRVQFTTKNNNSRSSRDRGRGSSSSSASDGA